MKKDEEEKICSRCIRIGMIIGAACIIIGYLGGAMLFG